MDVPGSPGEHKRSAVFLEQSGGLQGALKVISNRYHAQVKVTDPQRCNELLTGAVPDLCVGHKGQGVVDPLFIPVHRHYLMVQFPELLGHMAAEPSQPDQKH